MNSEPLKRAGPQENENTWVAGQQAEKREQRAA